ncbi:MAG: glutathione S-transferase family protein [Desulfofustis sp.]|nr:glutathione S-transferase family protein [Desulfofustis sp.]MBT8345857.1 glutathione S-transferase family protein [Desulfofustis sp.]NNK56173.1 glutathione S-transferase family protein [Desulfofustis sp.]RZW14167.1 MAG: glutathione S-transferase family protein [Desulfobulbaceae bacterium]
MYTLVIGNKNYSSWSLRGWLLLRQFQIGFDEIRLPLYSEIFSEKIKDYSPTGLVPTLVSGDLSIWDSLAICEYIAEQHPALHCWPEDVQARAIARSISSEMHSGFFQIRNLLPMNIRRHRAIDTISADLAKEIERVCDIWKSCRQFYKGDGDFLFGSFSIADVMYAPMVLRFKSYLIEVGESEAEYMQSMLALTSLQEWIDAALAEEEVIDLYEK